MVRKSRMKEDFWGAHGMGRSEFCASNRMEFKPNPHVGLYFWGYMYPLPPLQRLPKQRVLEGVSWGCPRSTHLYCWLPASPQRLQWLVRGP